MGLPFHILCNDNFFPALKPGKDIFGQRRVEIVRYRYLSRQQAQAALSAPSESQVEPVWQLAFQPSQ